MKVYLAGPLGFSEAGRAFHYDKLIPAIRELGHEVLDPWSLTDHAKIESVQQMRPGDSKLQAWKLLNAEIGKNNTNAIDNADALVAVLDGPDIDSGTAAEIGYAYARGLPILGYRSDFRQIGDNEGSIVNLQVEYFIRTSGGTIVSSLEQLSAPLLRMLSNKNGVIEKAN